MNNRSNLLKFNIIFAIYTTIGCTLTYYIKDSLMTEYFKEYIVLLISYFLVGGLFILTVTKYKIDIFQPFILISVIYICMFSITPIIFILNGKTDVHGVDVMSGCIKATLIYIISYIAFVIGYVSYRVKPNKNNRLERYSINDLNKNKILSICYIIWGIAYIITIFYMLSTGSSIIQILTIGSKASKTEVINTSVLGFLSNFSYCLIIPWLYICYLGKNTILKLIISYLTVGVYVIRGFRFIIIIMAISFIIVYYRKRMKLPKVTTLLVILCSGLIFIGALGYARNSFRTGVEVNWSEFNVDSILYALESNFDIYKTFYGIVEHYPSEYSYTFGKSMILETITMFVPRAIWPEKPLAVDASVVKAISRSVSEFAINNAAMATPNIGEFYVDFGILGCIVCMFLFGSAAKCTTKFYFIRSSNINYIILYSVIMPTFLQLVIRGYMPSNFYLVAFLLVPFYSIRLVSKIK